MENPDIRWVQRFQNFKRAFAQLSKGVATARERELNELEQQGLIQAFEFTHELAWKTLKDFLEQAGVKDLFGSVNATRAAFARGLIENGEAWMEMIKSRNLTTHTYNESTADQVSEAILESYASEFAVFLERFQELEKEN